MLRWSGIRTILRSPLVYQRTASIYALTFGLVFLRLELHVLLSLFQPLPPTLFQDFRTSGLKNDSGWYRSDVPIRVFGSVQLCTWLASPLAAS